MRLIHYTDEPFDLQPMDYDQSSPKWNAKPIGLWVSVEGEGEDDDWKVWCESQEFRLHLLKYSYEVILTENANILHLKTPEEVFEFSKKYPLKTRYWGPGPDTYELDWFAVKKEYQGIIISPYQWPCRLAFETCWYYGWDCSSGCIWDIDCIKDFKLTNTLNENELEKLKCSSMRNTEDLIIRDLINISASTPIFNLEK